MSGFATWRQALASLRSSANAGADHKATASSHIAVCFMPNAPLIPADDSGPSIRPAFNGMAVHIGACSIWVVLNVGRVRFRMGSDVRLRRVA
jgi:hypothetical protein